MNAITPIHRPHRSAMSNGAKPRHKRVARAIGYVLALGFDGDRMAGLVTILSARLSKAERAGLAYSALRSLDDDTAYQTASVALFGVMDGEVAR